MESASFNYIPALIYIGFLVFVVASFWRAFEKANAPGVASIIPIFNLVVMCNIGGISPWLVLAMFIPVVNIFIGLYIYYKFFEAYVSEGLALLGAFFPIFVVPYVGFSSSVDYR